MCPARIKPQGATIDGTPARGGLGADLERDDVREARNKYKRKMEYASQVRDIQREIMAKQTPKPQGPKPVVKSKTEIAREYAEHIKRPKLRQTKESSSDHSAVEEETEDGKLSILIQRHWEDCERVREIVTLVAQRDFHRLGG